MSARDQRLAEAPMDFTGDDLARGAFAAWLVFMIILLSVLTVLSAITTANIAFTLVGLGYAAGIGGPVAALVALAASPLAWLVGRLLKHEPTIIVHVVAYSALGAGIGAGVLLLGVAWSSSTVLDVFSSGWAWAVMAATAASVAAGWAWALRHARRRYPHGVTARRILAHVDDDAAVEDRAAQG